MNNPFRHRPTLFLAIEVINGFASGPEDGHAIKGMWYTDPQRHISIRTNETLGAMGLTDWPRDAIPFVMKPYGVNARNPRPRMAPYMRGPDSLTDAQRLAWLSVIDKYGTPIVYTGSRESGDNNDWPELRWAHRARVNTMLCVGPHYSPSRLTIMDNCQPADPEFDIRTRTRSMAKRGYRIGGEAFPKDPEWLKWCPYFARHCYVTSRLMPEPIVRTQTLTVTWAEAYPIPRKAELLVGFDGMRTRPQYEVREFATIVGTVEEKRPVTAAEVHAVIKRLWNAKSITLVINSPLDAPGVYEAWKQHKENRP